MRNLKTIGRAVQKLACGLDHAKNALPAPLRVVCAWIVEKLLDLAELMLGEDSYAPNVDEEPEVH